MTDELNNTNPASTSSKSPLSGWTWHDAPRSLGLTPREVKSYDPKDGSVVGHLSYHLASGKSSSS